MRKALPGVPCVIRCVVASRPAKVSHAELSSIAGNAMNVRVAGVAWLLAFSTLSQDAFAEFVKQRLS